MLLEENVVIGLGVERRVEVHKVYRLILDVAAEHVQVVAVLEGVRLAHGRSTPRSVSSRRRLSGIACAAGNVRYCRSRSASVRPRSGERASRARNAPRVGRKPPASLYPHGSQAILG